MNSILDKYDNKSLREYLSICSQYTNIDIDKGLELAINAIKYYRGDSSKRERLRIFQELENKWYLSLDNENPDYSLYNDKYLLSDIWACWVVYSRKYLLAIRSDKNIVDNIGNIYSVADLGCGFGYTTAALGELFPNASVYGTNIESTYQYKIAQEFGNTYKYSMIPSIIDSKIKIDLVFASEYFEHIENSVEHLVDIITVCNPTYFIIANSFNAISFGHFYKYIYNGEFHDGRYTSRLFNKTLREHGYYMIDTKFWNNRPMCWKRLELKKWTNALLPKATP